MHIRNIIMYNKQTNTHTHTHTHIQQHKWNNTGGRTRREQYPVSFTADRETIRNDVHKYLRLAALKYLAHAHTHTHTHTGTWIHTLADKRA